MRRPGRCGHQRRLVSFGARPSPTPGCHPYPVSCVLSTSRACFALRSGWWPSQDSPGRPSTSLLLPVLCLATFSLFFLFLFLLGFASCPSRPSRWCIRYAIAVLIGSTVSSWHCNPTQSSTPLRVFPLFFSRDLLLFSTLIFSNPNDDPSCRHCYSPVYLQSCASSSKALLSPKT